MARLSCECGEVEIYIPTLPIMRLECCCTDCRRARTWCAEQAEKKNEEKEKEGGGVGELTAASIPVDLVYFANALRVERGSNHLRCYLLKEGYNTRRIVAGCCWTCLLGTHPVYEGLRLVTYNDPPGKLTLDADEKLHPADERIFKDDLTAEELAALQPEGPTSVPRWYERDLSGESKAALDALPHDNNYTTAEAVMKSIGHLEIMDPQFEGPIPIWNKWYPNGPNY